MADIIAQDKQILTAEVLIASLFPHPKNYNFHPISQIEKLQKSLRKFGQVQSIVVQEADNNTFIIIAGHALVEAARAEGWETLIARVIPREWSEQKILAYLAADNELARFSNRDEAQLIIILEEIAAFDHELFEATGYNDILLENLIASLKVETADKDGEWKEYDESIIDKLKWVECPKCGHRWQQ